jgi:hypothetical protein
MYSTDDYVCVYIRSFDLIKEYSNQIHNGIWSQMCVSN